MTVGNATERSATGIAAMARLLRPAHWIKNGFVAAPFLLTPGAWSWSTAVSVALGIVAFSLLASAVYVLNDYMDRDADRRHPVKRMRPIASGTIRPATAAILGGAVAAAGLGLALYLGTGFAALAVAYLLLNLAYCLRLKQVAIVDVLIVAFGFILRVEAGAVLAGVQATAWIVIMTGLLALFIALAKRRDDLVMEIGRDHRGSLEGYTKPFLDQAMTLVLGALLAAYLVYTTDQQVMERLGTRNVFYTAPFVVAGILRYLQIALVEERSGSPVRLILSDPFLIAAVTGWAITFALVIHL